MSQHNMTCSTPTTEDQRTESRTATVFRPVILEAADFVSFALVRNLSPNGMRAKVCGRFPSGSPISVQFGSDHLVQGRIIWCDRDHIGVKFEQMIDVAQMLASVSKKVLHGRRNRALRLPIRSRGELVIGDRELKIEIQDISLRGIKVVTSYVRPGDEVLVSLKGLGQRKAEVRWTEGGMAGLNFLRPFSYDELAHWAMKRPAAGVAWASQETDNKPAQAVQPDYLRRSA